MFKSKLLTVVVSILVGLFIAGCASSPTYNKLEVKEKEVVKVYVPDELLTPCIPDKPIDRETYLAQELHEREIYLTNYNISILRTLKECNIKLEKIKEFNKKN